MANTTYTHRPQYAYTEATMESAANLATLALETVGTNITRGTTAEDEVAAIRWALAQYEEDDSGQYTADDCRYMLSIISHIVTAPRRRGEERSDG